MDTSVSWEVVKEFYKEKFGIDQWVVEMFANMDILILCASGASNESIETFLEVPINEIVKVLEQTFNFRGWQHELPINPYYLFTHYDGVISSVKHFTDFVSEVDLELEKFSTFRESKDIDVQKLFYICETMYDIERKIQDEWI